MKTIEEKAKAYDEIIERAKTMLAAGEVMYGKENNASQLITDLIPELRESEDERIRAVILKLVLGMRDEIFTTADKLVTKPKVLAWLEKQKEHVPENEESGTRKEQKPAWSEEGMKVLNSIIDDYEKAAKSFCGYDGKIGLLKAIRDGEYDLSKQEWSEEDEKTYNLLLNHFRQAFERRTTSLTREEIEKIYDFLKDLRLKKGQIICVDADRIQEYLSRITWKPTQEQMAVLLNAEGLMRANDYKENAKILAELYKELKKL